MDVAEVIATDEFADWYRALERRDADAVDASVLLLEQLGVRLGFPYSSAIRGSRHALRERRVQSGGRPLRVFYAFDPHRCSVLLIGGDKTGDGRFYERFIPWAESIWEQYLAELRAGGEEPER